MIRILLFPNISYPSKSEDLTKNSYFEFLSLTIELMQKKREDIFWYIVSPTPQGKRENEIQSIRKKLDFSNTHFIEMNVPEKPFNRIHFDINELKQKYHNQKQT